MALALLWAVTLFLVATGLHMFLLDKAFAAVVGEGKGRPDRWRLMLFLLAVLIMHLVSAAIFATGFWTAELAGLGTFRDEPVMGWADYLYYSLVNLTTVGIAQIYPAGHQRLLTGTGSLAGFLLISASASYVFKIVRPDDQ